MLKYKVLALDLDDTLLTKDKQISDESKKWIKRASDLGIIVVIATGRGYHNMKQFREELNLLTPMVLVNGAEAWTESVEIIKRSFITQEDMRFLLNLTDEVNADFWVYGVNSFIRKAEWVDDMLNENWTQFVARHDDPKVLYDIKCKIENLSDSLEITRSSLNNIEFTMKGTSKASGMQAVCKYLNIDMKEVMAIGDNFNDMKLIKTSGLGVAMGNAVQELKEIAHSITDTNDRDGVAKAIKHHIFGEEDSNIQEKDALFEMH